MIPVIAFITASLIVVYFLTFRSIVYILSGGMFAFLLVMLPDVIMKDVLIDIFGENPSILLYLLTISAIIFVVYLCVEKNLKRNWFLNISLGIGLLVGLFVNVTRLILAR